MNCQLLCVSANVINRSIGVDIHIRLYLMWKQDEGLELLKIDEEQIKKFKLKWEQDYGRQSALKGFLQPLVNKIVRDMQEVLMSEAAALESQEDNKSAPESVRNRDEAAPLESQEDVVSRIKGKRKKNQNQGKIVGDKRLTRREAQKQGIHPIGSLK
ncbi:hypothetical protein Tco_1442691 [Tanacetum coccineum]